MPRIVRHPELRRAELLDHSLRLFLEREFANTSLNNVIATSGLSNGAFYHYFSSKDALLDALAARLAEERLSALQLPPRTPKDTAVTRLNQVLEIRTDLIQCASRLRFTIFTWAPCSAGTLTRA